MGRAHDRNGVGQCSLHQPQEREGRQESEERQRLSWALAGPATAIRCDDLQPFNLVADCETRLDGPGAVSVNGRVPAPVGESFWGHTAHHGAGTTMASGAAGNLQRKRWAFWSTRQREPAFGALRAIGCGFSASPVLSGPPSSPRTPRNHPRATAGLGALERWQSG